MSNLQANWCLKIDFQKVNQHAGGKWLIHDTKRRKDNQLQQRKNHFLVYLRTPSLIMISWFVFNYRANRAYFIYNEM